MADLNLIFNRRPILITGPCTYESKNQFTAVASQLPNLNINFIRGGAYKPRTSPESFQGYGLDGLKAMYKIAKRFKLYLVSEIMDSESLKLAHPYVDVIQVGSRNMSSFGLLKKIGKLTSKSQKPILLKRGFSSTLKELISASKYIEKEGNNNIIFCLRGIRTFEQIDSSFRNTPDLASIIELKEMTKYPVIFDPSHSAGNSRYVIPISRAALTIGSDGLIIECHPKPSKAKSDNNQQLTIAQLKDLLNSINY
ncbi:3-deoxy-7-phosphoheptulonate synthase [Candidatus Woesearchaeota archaeon]|nr:3-deoxy-7-phosphoheptulonate synthase [Candidatus Woesearchaeota archaeon]